MTLFNSLHAGASVNHVHFHSVYRRKPFPIENAGVRKVGDYYVLDGYPASGLVFERNRPVDELWPCIARLQERNFPYNLIAGEERIHLIARDPEHEMVEEFPGGVMASMELSGKLITTDEQFYVNVGQQLINSALAKTTLQSERLLQAITGGAV
jgi:hypothetical protein